MNLFSFVASIAHIVSSLQLDDSSVGLIALLAGMAAGWRLPAWQEQLKARRAKIERKPQGLPRKPD